MTSPMGPNSAKLTLHYAMYWPEGLTGNCWLRPGLDAASLQRLDPWEIFSVVFPQLPCSVASLGTRTSCPWTVISMAADSAARACSSTDLENSVPRPRWQCAGAAHANSSASRGEPVVVGFGLLGFPEIAPRRNVAEQAPGIRSLPRSAAHGERHVSSARPVASSRRPASTYALPQGETTEHLEIHSCRCRRLFPDACVSSGMASATRPSRHTPSQGRRHQGEQGRVVRS